MEIFGYALLFFLCGFANYAFNASRGGFAMLMIWCLPIAGVWLLGWPSLIASIVGIVFGGRVYWNAIANGRPTGAGSLPDAMAAKGYSLLDEADKSGKKKEDGYDFTSRTKSTVDDPDTFRLLLPAVNDEIYIASQKWDPIEFRFYGKTVTIAELSLKQSLGKNFRYVAILVKTGTPLVVFTDEIGDGWDFFVVSIIGKNMRFNYGKRKKREFFEFHLEVIALGPQILAEAESVD